MKTIFTSVPAQFGKIVIFVLLAGACLAADNTGATSTSVFPKPQPITERGEYKPDVGLLLGVASPDGNYTNTTEYGLTTSYQPFIPVAVGLEVNRSRPQVRNSGETLDRTNLWTTATYNFGGSSQSVIRYSYLGIGLGAVLKPDGTDFQSAPILGFDVPLKNNDQTISLGARAKYALISGTNPNTISVDAVVKYWF